MKLGELLVAAGACTAAQVEAALAGRAEGERIGQVLVRLGHVEEDAVLDALGRQADMPVVDLADIQIDPELIQKVPVKAIFQRHCLPLRRENGTLTVAIADPLDLRAVDELRLLMGCRVEPVLARARDIEKLLKVHFGVGAETVDRMMADAGGELQVIRDEDGAGKDDLEMAEDASLIKFVNQLLVEAIQSRASDVHIEPLEKDLRIRMRVDGVLHKVSTPPGIKRFQAAILSRVKIMSNLNIAEKRKPQDGRIKLKLSRTRAVDFRVSVLPTLFGESAVLRILDPSKLKVDLAALGLSEANLKQYLKALHAPQGLCLVTGPTGSGKTNTLYSGIAVLNKPEVKILTAEDPVEFNFPGINQVHVDAQAGLTFAGTLRAFLRQDPEVILVGEIRDLETAEIAVKAAMTGHMVLSTLHTNDCPSTVGRLLDIGIPGFMLSSCLVLILAQRLGKKICSQCKEPLTKISAAKLIEAGFQKEEFPTLKLYKGKGCPVCNSTGNKGRIGIFEIMECTESVKKAISAQLPEDQLRKIATKDGMLSLRMDALQKAREGMISLDEVLSKTVSHTDSLPAYLLTPDEKVFQDGDLIIKEGNTDKNFYQLMQGSVVITKGGRVIGEISQPGDYFGEMSALLDQPRVATIKSKGKSVVKVFPGDKLKETLINYPDISLKIIRSLINRLNETDRRLSRMVEQQQQQ